MKILKLWLAGSGAQRLHYLDTWDINGGRTMQFGNDFPNFLHIRDFFHRNLRNFFIDLR